MTLINAHRGNPIDFRENTMSAFESAVVLGADCIELDVRATKDGQAAIMHDATLTRMWGVDEAVSSMTYVEMLSLTAGQPVIPLLRDVLASFDIPIMVDFDDSSSVEPIISTLITERASKRCVVSSGNVPALCEIRDRLPEVSIALTWNDILRPSQSLMERLDIQYFNPYFRLHQDEFVSMLETLHSGDSADSSSVAANADLQRFMQAALNRRRQHPEWYDFDALCGSAFINWLHGKGIKVSAWTVDEVPDMKAMIDLGVDMITTNQTRRLIEVRKETR